MLRSWKHRPVVLLATGLCVGLLVGVGMLIGTLATVSQRSSTERMLPETLLHATASHSAKTMAMATGWIDDEVEGLFVLDYLTGNLNCYVLNKRNIMPPLSPYSVFSTNIVGDLEVQTGKEPNFVMVTGQMNFPRSGGAAVPANCVVYVADANTGNFAAYSLAINRNLMSGGSVQKGMLMLITRGKARNMEIGE